MAYLGAKSHVSPALLALMPPHDTYIEPFAGSAVIFRRKAAAARSILVERDPDQAAALRAWRASAGADMPGMVEILTGDAMDHLAALDVAAAGRLLIYADPPYPLSTRTGRDRYAYELTDADHRALAAILHQLGAQGAAVMISSYPSALYDALYEGWGAREFQAMTRGGVRTEKVWMNFEPGAVHWATVAGHNFTDRQRIKRKAARWARMFNDLPPAERQAILAALLAARDPP